MMLIEWSSQEPDPTTKARAVPIYATTVSNHKPVECVTME